MLRHTAVFIFLVILIPVKSSGEETTKDVKRNLWSLHISQLYTGVTVGIAPLKDKTYLSLGVAYGKPTRKNAWRKFIPQFAVTDDMSDDAKEVLQNMSTKDLHAGMISVGVCREMVHRVSLYGQVGWGFVVDLSAATEEEKEALDSDNSGKNIFIYNTVPVELGVNVDVWKGWSIQGGITYLWKEIPLLTLGVGYVF
jgi:hypothetical protein